MNASTVESGDEAHTVPLDADTIATPHCLTLCYARDKTPKQLSDKFPQQKLHKNPGESILIERSHSADILLNAADMPRSFVELWCQLERACRPHWYIKKKDTSKKVQVYENGNSVSLNQHQRVEISDSCRIKLEYLTFTVRIEDGDDLNGDFEVQVLPHESESGAQALDVHSPSMSCLLPHSGYVAANILQCSQVCSINTCQTCGKTMGLQLTAVPVERPTTGPHDAHVTGVTDANVCIHHESSCFAMHPIWASNDQSNNRNNREPVEDDERHTQKHFH